MEYRRISADCHIDLCWMPPELFVSEASVAFRDRMPYVTDGPDGPYWTSRNGVSLRAQERGRAIRPEIRRRPALPGGPDGRRRASTTTAGGTSGACPIRTFASGTWSVTGSTRRSSTAFSGPRPGFATMTPRTRCSASTMTGWRSSAATTRTGTSGSRACPTATSTRPSRSSGGWRRWGSGASSSPARGT